MNRKHLALLLVSLVVVLVVGAVGGLRLPALAGRPEIAAAAAVVVGVVCGVAASVPVSLGLLLALGSWPGLRAGATRLEAPTATPAGTFVLMPTTTAEMEAMRPPDWAVTMQALGYPLAGWTPRVIRGGKNA